MRSWVLLATVLVTTPVIAGEEPATPKFTRVSKGDDPLPLTLETSVVRYVPADPKAKPVVVDLIGAVHVGDAGYYDKLNTKFQEYDALLYEFVAPESHNVPVPYQKSGSPVSSVQRFMKEVMYLEFQLDRIDYTKKNFVHADMSPNQFDAAMKERGESFIGMMLKIMTSPNALGRERMKDMEIKTNLAMLALLLADDKGVAVKRLMADQLADVDIMTKLFEGKNGSAIITARNIVALQVLRKQLKAGKKRIGIFYGAGHLADMHVRLVKEFGLKPVNTEWYIAWDMRPKK
jgi:hypothetical protein